MSYNIFSTILVYKKSRVEPLVGSDLFETSADHVSEDRDGSK